MFNLRLWAPILDKTDRGNILPASTQINPLGILQVLQISMRLPLIIYSAIFKQTTIPGTRQVNLCSLNSKYVVTDERGINMYTNMLLYFGLLIKCINYKLFI